ncbi:MAG: spore cortex biosynthesis protein YabQ [Oscillospiraceae bacterium]|nr:spore cortex biosynthesis protein YabQ [Oscillospiraceae bacterium]
MENHVVQQLCLLGLSALLGSGGALLYDILRTAVRLRHRARKVLTHLADGLYAVAMLAVLAVFMRRYGGGELRLYMVLGILGGAAFYFLLPAALLRPLWDFWAQTADETLRLLCLPAALVSKWIKKVSHRAKKDFLFFRKYAKINRYRWDFILIHRRIGGKGGRVHREKRKKREAKP